MTHQRGDNRPGEAVPEGLWTKCPQCGDMLYQPEMEQDLYVCRHCGHHRRLTARERIAITADEGSFIEHDAAMHSSDPLSFPGYGEKLREDAASTGLRDAFVWGECSIEGLPVSLAVMDFSFRGGSMGAVVGEKFARAAEHAVARRIPLLVFACSGGARMQEGIVSLLQMAKTTTVVGRLERERVPFVVVYTDPLTAGVFASFASVADIAIAEHKALVGFAGPRVIEKAFKIKLPPGSHTAEFQYEHGMVDSVVPRRQLRPLLGRILRLLSPEPKEDVQ
ncbi:MAG TPA: acetyl-CoA carboxylase carboxyltransferase subunit beta [Armatimonadota bacterium]|nr:acetyl-CoA carboxylase carboxyltransferase subunit beta [Armatimonadota bacterium]